MGQKTNPIGFRTGITLDWKSRWYAPKAAYGEFLIEDYKLRKYVDERLNRTAAVRGGEQGRDRADAQRRARGAAHGPAGPGHRARRVPRWTSFARSSRI